MPRLLHPVVTTVAAASFYIYLTHVIPVEVIYWTLKQKGLVLNVAVALALGVGVWAVVQRLDLSFEGIKRRLGRRQGGPAVGPAEPSS
jgi:hypothetical protein